MRMLLLMFFISRPFESLLRVGQQTLTPKFSPIELASLPQCPFFSKQASYHSSDHPSESKAQTGRLCSNPAVPVIFPDFRTCQSMLANAARLTVF